MLFSSKHVARGGFIALAALAMAAPSWAGQVNLSARSTVISESVTTSITNSGGSGSITGSGISTTDSGGTSTEIISRSITISETFVGASATVSFEVAQEDINYTSPYDNLFITPSVVQSVTGSGGSGITTTQVTAGAGNVSVASNGIIDGATLASITGTLGTSTAAGAAQVATLALTPGFALQNSNANALTQAAVMAIAGSGAAVTAIDVQQSGLDEYSPHGNTALMSGFVDQTVIAGAAAGISTVQAQVGAGNVQATHTVILYGADVGGNSGLFQ
jgi:hypothetical protein